MVWQVDKPAGTDALKNSDDDLRANNVEIELRRLDNLLDNSSFEYRSAGTSAVPDGWSLEGTPTVAYDTVDVGYGNYALKLTGSGASNEGINQTLTNLKVSTKYQVFWRTKVTAGDTSSLITTGATTNIDTDSTSASWETKIGEFVTDSSATDVVLKLVAAISTDVAYFCGITVVEGDIPPSNFIRRIDERNYGIKIGSVPYFLVRPTSDQTNIATGSAITVVWGTETADIGGNFASNAFTAPVTGKYHFDISLELGEFDSAASTYGVALITTGGTFQKVMNPKLSADARWNIALSITVPMTATNTAHVTITQISGTQQTDVDTDSYFSGILVG